MGRRRIPIISVRSLGEWDVSTHRPGCVVVDLHNTLLAYTSTRADIASACARLRDLQTRLSSQSRLLVATNARMPDEVRHAMVEMGQTYVDRARKPLTFKLGNNTAGRPRVVVGDQILTDGLLAWNLGVPFVHVSGCSAEEPAWPTVQRNVGKLLRRLFFVEGQPGA